MTITDRICQALKTHMVNQGVNVLATVQPGLTDTVNAATDSRVIIRGTSASMLGPHLRGIFSVTGEVIARQSIDENDAKASFNALCVEIKDILLDETAIETALPQIDSAIHIYSNSWHMDEQGESAGERGFQAVFNWRATARDTTTTN